jgi:hypothetical protein
VASVPPSAQDTPRARHKEYESDSALSAGVEEVDDDEVESATSHTSAPTHPMITEDSHHTPLLPSDHVEDLDDELSRSRFHDGLQGLLTLRAEDRSAVMPIVDESSDIATAPVAGPGLDDFMLTSQFDPQNIDLDNVSEEQTLLLLQQWRYEVAPWVCFQQSIILYMSYLILDSLIYAISGTASASTFPGSPFIPGLSCWQSCRFLRYPWVLLRKTLVQ